VSPGTDGITITPRPFQLLVLWLVVALDWIGCSKPG